MGKRKRLAAEARKEAMKSTAIAKWNDIPTSPRKMRIVADTIRGQSVEHALNLLKFNPKHAARKLEQVLLSAMYNWKLKNEGERAEDSDLFVKTVFIDEGRTLKRFQPAPQGRAYRIRKRSNHITLIVDSRIPKAAPAVEEAAAEETEAAAAETTKPAAKTAKPKAAAKKTAKPAKAAPKKTAKPAEKKEEKKPAKKTTKKK